MPRLVLNQGDEKGKAFQLKEGQNRVGRSDDNAIKIDDASVSSHHAEIVVAGKRVTVRDLGSTNGTRIGGRKVQEAELLEGDQIMFGIIPFVYQVSPPRPPPRGGIRADQIGVAQSPSPDKVSTVFKTKE